MNKILLVLSVSIYLLAGCKSFQKTSSTPSEKSGTSNTEKGAVVGATSGAVVGGVIGNRSDNTVLGAILGATVGGTVGVLIGNKMDKKAQALKDELGKTAIVERVGEGIKLTFNSELLFDFGKSDLKESNKTDLRKFAESLKQSPETDLLVIGHTDNVGSDEFNQMLSEKRADAVAGYLIANGVAYARLKIQGWGESQPAVLNDTDNNRSQNRRVEIAIYANEQMIIEAKKESGEK